MSERSLEAYGIGPVLRLTTNVQLLIFAVRGYPDRVRAVYVEIQVCHVKLARDVLGHLVHELHLAELEE